jgi:2-polyprenyl-6-methoxyphenol hydroxylase-like FAD-dependent oxidoreductase
VDGPLAGLKVAIVGGSVIGCAAATALAAAGADVTVLERSQSELETRGSVLGLPGRLIPSLLERNLLTSDFVWRQIPNRQWLVKDGDEPMGRLIWEQPFTISSVSWAALFQGFRNNVPDSSYRKGSEVTAVADDAAGPRVSLASGEVVRANLVVAADGYLSGVRERLFGGGVEQSYSGYVVWRGWFDEREGLLRSVEHLEGPMKTVGFEHGHASVWLVPSSESAQPGRRQVTWNIYGGPLPPGILTENGAVMSVPPGRLSTEQRAFLHDLVDEVFPPLLADVVKVTPQPALTPVYDVKVPSLAAGRIVLVGDAGTVVRPVTGSGAVKGVEDALALADALVRTGGDVDAAVAEYNAERLPIDLGLVDLGQRMGVALVDDVPDWPSLSAEELEGWMADAMSGWYATEEAADASRQHLR